MPIYEYACSACDHRMDALQKVSDAALRDCPSCGEPGLQRLLSAPRFCLKGQGWYETDFKTDKQRNIAGEKEPAKADAGKPDAKASADSGSKVDTQAPAASSSKVDTKSSS